MRRATAADVPQLVELRRAFTLEELPPATVERDDFEAAFAAVVGAGIESSRWVVTVATLGGEIVSHAFVGVIEKIPRPVRGSRAIGYLTNVYTVPEHRGRGVGARVLEWLQAWARESDIELLVVWPSDESVHLYRRLGFEPPPDALVWDSGVGDY